MSTHADVSPLETKLERIRELEKIARSLDPSADAREHSRSAVIRYSEDFLHNIESLNAFNASSDNGIGILDARNTIAKAIVDVKPEHIADRAVFKKNLRIHLKRFVQKELSSKPVIVTTVVEI